ncbi:MAG: penicillin acylase family protein [Gluconacetobacter sp.]
MPMCAPGPSRALFFADGYLVAQDQLWELDFGHHRSLGRLAELFSAAFVPSETANRLILFRGDDEQELAAFPPPWGKSAHGPSPHFSHADVGRSDEAPSAGSERF